MLLIIEFSDMRCNHINDCLYCLNETAKGEDKSFKSTEASAKLSKGKTKQKILPSIVSKIESTPVDVAPVLMSQRPFGQFNIRGVAVGVDKLFLAQQASPVIKVFDSNTLKSQADITVKDLKNPWDIVAVCGQLMISEQNEPKLHKFVNEEEQTYFTLEGAKATLSVTPSRTILVSYPSKRMIEEYMPDGIIVNQIYIGSDRIIASHAMLFSTEEFIVTDIKSQPNRLVKLNCAGTPVDEYGGPTRVDTAPLNMPQYLIAYHSGDILVADQNNDRIVLMSSKLEFKRELIQPKDNLKKPIRMCLDVLNGRLYVAEEKQNRVKVFNLLSSI